MATLYAQATGNWSAILWNTAANGSGSNQTPAAADTLVSNTFNVTVDGNYTVTRVTNTLGGTFLLTNGITLTCTDATAGVLGNFANVAAVTNALSSPNAATITGNVSVSGSNSIGVAFTSTGRMTINGNVTTASLTSNAIIMSGSGELIINGSLTNNWTWCIIASNAGSINITGNITNGFGVYVTGTTSVSVTGNVLGGSNSNNVGIRVEGNATVSVVGNVTGGSGGAAHGIAIASGNGPVTIVGNVTAATGNGINSAGTGAVIITGSVSAKVAVSGAVLTGSGNILITGSVFSESAVGVSSTGAGDLRIIGTLNGFAVAAISKTNGTSFLTGPFLRNVLYPSIQVVNSTRWVWDSSLVNSTYMEVYKSDLTTKHSIYTSDSFSLPAIANVRTGIVYGPTNLVGTCAVPPAANVSLNVPVDNTVGTGYISVAEYTTLFESIFGLDPGQDLMEGLAALLGLEPGENLLTELEAIETQIEADLVSIDGRLENLEDRLAEQVPEGPVIVIPPPGPLQTTAWCMCFTEDGEPEKNVEIIITCLKATDNGAFDSAPKILKSNVEGLASGTIPRGAGFTFSARRGNGKTIKFNGVDEETLELPTLLGSP